MNNLNTRGTNNIYLTRIEKHAGLQYSEKKNGLIVVAQLNARFKEHKSISTCKGLYRKAAG